MKNENRQYEKPFDLFGKNLGKQVEVTTMTGKVVGKLLAWDPHMNLILNEIVDAPGKTAILRGEHIKSVSVQDEGKKA